MIYSTSMFMNELELLDLKIKEESPHVDKIFIVESELTFTGNPKSVAFPKGKYDSYGNVEHVLLDKTMFDNDTDAWVRQERQRNAITDLVSYSDDDVWIVMDLDEIIPGEYIPILVEETRKRGALRMGMQLYYYYINTQFTSDVEWHPIMTTGVAVREHTLDYLRDCVFFGHRVGNCGKHFSYLSNPEGISLKLKSFAHTELGGPEFTDVERIKNHMDQLSDICGRGKKLEVVEIDSSYPKTILNNLAEWEQYIYAGQASEVK